MVHKPTDNTFLDRFVRAFYYFTFCIGFLLVVLIFALLFWGINLIIT